MNDGRNPLEGGHAFAAAAVQAEARRILDELVERGDLTTTEAEEMAAAVRDAARATERLVEQRVLRPLGRAMQRVRELADDPSGAGRETQTEAESVHLGEQLADLAARLDRIERRLRTTGTGE